MARPRKRQRLGPAQDVAGPFNGPRKNFHTAAVVFDDPEKIKRLEELIRPLYSSEDEYTSWHFLDLVFLVHHTKKSDLETVLKTPDLLSFLEGRRETFDFANGLQKICTYLGPLSQDLTRLEGSIHLAARRVHDPVAKRRFISSFLQLCSELEALLKEETRLDNRAASSHPQGLDDPLDLKTVNDDNYADEQKATHTATPLMLPVDQLRTFLAPGLWSGMMSTSYRQKEQNNPIISAVSIRGPVSEDEEYILEIITSSIAGVAVKEARKPVELGAALGEILYGWMDATECAQQRKRKGWTPPVKVVPRDGRQVDGDQVVMVTVGSEHVEFLRQKAS